MSRNRVLRQPLARTRRNNNLHAQHIAGNANRLALHVPRVVSVLNLSPFAFSQIPRGDKAVLQYTAGNSEAAAEGKARARLSISISFSYLQFHVPFFLNFPSIPGVRKYGMRRDAPDHLFMTHVYDAVTIV